VSILTIRITSQFESVAFIEIHQITRFRSISFIRARLKNVTGKSISGASRGNLRLWVKLSSRF